MRPCSQPFDSLLIAVFAKLQVLKFSIECRKLDLTKKRYTLLHWHTECTQRVEVRCGVGTAAQPIPHCTGVHSMSKLSRTAAAIAIAATSGFSVADAQSPAGTTVQSRQTTQINEPIAQSAQPSAANSTASASSNKMHQGPTIKEAISSKLVKANDAEIELAKLAMQQSDNSDLKEFAEMIIKDHQDFNAKLTKHVGKHHAGKDQAKQGEADQSSPNASNGNDSRQTQAGRASDVSTQRVPMQLCKIGEIACENSLKMTKEALGKLEGQDFTMAYLGQQCVAHTTMLAELKAIETAGPEDLREVASKAAGKVQEHLEKAKQLAKKFEDDRKSKS